MDSHLPKKGNILSVGDCGALRVVTQPIVGTGGASTALTPSSDIGQEVWRYTRWIGLEIEQMTELLAINISPISLVLRFSMRSKESRDVSQKLCSVTP
jgi:hypothetical protein